MTTTYGSDFSGTDDLDFGLTFLEDSGELLALSQAVARRFLTPRGGLFYALDYGLDIRLFLADSIPVQMAQGLIEAEARKDERVNTASCVIAEVSSDQGESWTVEISVTPADASGPFTLTFVVTPDTVSLAS